MPIPIPNDRTCSGDPGGRTVGLPVLAAAPKVRPSRMGPRRAAVLILVNLLMIAHLLVRVHIRMTSYTPLDTFKCKT